MEATKRKRLYWLFKILSVLVSIALPIWAIVDKFPLISVKEGAGKTIGFGVILILIVVLIVFRKTVFEFIAEKLDIKHAPPLIIWLVLIVISYVLLYLGNLMHEMSIVFWMGFIGCAIGNVLTYVSQKFADPEEKKEEADDNG